MKGVHYSLADTRLKELSALSRVHAGVTRPFFQGCKSDANSANQGIGKETFLPVQKTDSVNVVSGSPGTRNQEATPSVRQLAERTSLWLTATVAVITLVFCCGL